MEALQAVKDMFPQMSNSESMDPVDNVSISWKVEAAIVGRKCEWGCFQDSKQIMKNEFVSAESIDTVEVEALAPCWVAPTVSGICHE